MLPACRTMANGEEIPATVIVQDHQNDLALLRLPIAPAQWLVFREGPDAWQGEEVIALATGKELPLLPLLSISVHDFPEKN